MRLDTLLLRALRYLAVNLLHSPHRLSLPPPPNSTCRARRSALAPTPPWNSLHAAQPRHLTLAALLNSVRSPLLPLKMDQTLISTVNVSISRRLWSLDGAN